MALKLPKASAQYVILTDASFYAAGYVLLIEEYASDQSGKQNKTYVAVSFGSKIKFSHPHTLSCQSMEKNF